MATLRPRCGLAQTGGVLAVIDVVAVRIRIERIGNTILIRILILVLVFHRVGNLVIVGVEIVGVRRVVVVGVIDGALVRVAITVAIPRIAGAANAFALGDKEVFDGGALEDGNRHRVGGRGIEDRFAGIVDGVGACLHDETDLVHPDERQV